MCHLWENLLEKAGAAVNPCCLLAVLLCCFVYFGDQVMLCSVCCLVYLCTGGGFPRIVSLGEDENQVDFAAVKCVKLELT